MSCSLAVSSAMCASFLTINNLRCCNDRKAKLFNKLNYGVKFNVPELDNGASFVGFVDFVVTCVVGGFIDVSGVRGVSVCGDLVVLMVMVLLELVLIVMVLSCYCYFCYWWFS